MGIQVEFNPDLALRAFGTLNRLEAECLPENIKVGEVYQFLKKGQRNYWLEGEIPLLETTGNGNLSNPLASIKLLIYSHIIYNNPPRLEKGIYTFGHYQVVEVFNDSQVHFNGFKKIN